jgi:hypothetical protein
MIRGDRENHPKCEQMTTPQGHFHRVIFLLSVKAYARKSKRKAVKEAMRDRCCCCVVCVMLRPRGNYVLNLSKN